MTVENEIKKDQAEPADIGVLEKWLSLWVALSIALGIYLGEMFPGLFHSLAALEYAHVNLVVAMLIWAMVYPMMMSLDHGSIRHVADQQKGLLIKLTTCPVLRSPHGR